MHHVVFVPKLGRLQDKLESCGLGADFIDGGTWAKELTDKESPTGEPGMMIVWDHLNAPSASDAKSLAWRPAVEHEGRPEGRYLVGVDPDNLPTPLELIRTNQVPGRRVQLGMHSWVIPSLGQFPLNLYPGNGGPLYTVARQLTQYWERAGIVRKVLLDANEGDTIDVSAAFDLVIDALNLNYRMPRELVGPLELLTSGINGTLIAASCAALWDGPDESTVIPVDLLKRGAV